MAIFLAQLQMLFVLMIGVAAVLLVVWIIRYRPEQITTWMFFFFAIGLIGLIISSVLVLG
jgi:hypothetical protein